MVASDWLTHGVFIAAAFGACALAMALELAWLRRGLAQAALEAVAAGAVDAPSARTPVLTRRPPSARGTPVAGGRP